MFLLSLCVFISQGIARNLVITWEGKKTFDAIYFIFLTLNSWFRNGIGCRSVNRSVSNKRSSTRTFDCKNRFFPETFGLRCLVVHNYTVSIKALYKACGILSMHEYGVKQAKFTVFSYICLLKPYIYLSWLY